MKNQTEDYSDVPADQDALLDKQQAARTLGISTRTVDNLVKGGDFPPGVRIGRFLYWSQRTIATWRRNQFASQERWRPRA